MNLKFHGKKDYLCPWSDLQKFSILKLLLYTYIIGHTVLIIWYKVRIPTHYQELTSDESMVLSNI